MATHQQNGQHCGRVNGDQGTQKPPAIRDGRKIHVPDVIRTLGGDVALRCAV
jgi:hypothetical protein